jgi:hypothetical protein
MSLQPYLLMEPSPSWEAVNCVVTQELPSIFKEPEGSSPYSQDPSIGPYSEPDQSSPYHPTIQTCSHRIILFGMNYHLHNKH